VWGERRDASGALHPDLLTDMDGLRKKPRWNMKDTIRVRVWGTTLLVLLSGLGQYASAQTATPSPHLTEEAIGCWDCHTFLHAAPPRGAEQEALCQSCHSPTGPVPSNVANHVVDGGSKIIDCATCHDPHLYSETTDPHDGSTATNLALIRGKIGKYYPNAVEPAIFHSKPGDFAFDAAPWIGICQTCHVSTNHHTNHDGVDHAHNVNMNCMVCHPHESGFLPSGGCLDCHSEPQGSRRQIVAPEGGSGGDFVKTSHHVAGAIQESDCTVCHFMGSHTSGVVRLRDPDAGANLIHDFDPQDPGSLEAFCLNCHDADGALDEELPLLPFSTPFSPPVVKDGSGGQWSNSAHHTVAYSENGGLPLTCDGDGYTTGCHSNGHGSDNIKLLSATQTESMSDFCFHCHTDGMVQNMAISGAAVADDIEEAFSFASSSKHNMGGSFTIGSDSYALECTTCHNPHLVTGQYWEADLDRTPVTRPDFSDPVNNPRAVGNSLWGDEAGEKMVDYGGTYRTPKSDIFSGSELPDYVSFCNTCHAPMSGPHGNLGFDNDPHGLNSANSPNGGGTPPDWYAVGKAEGWNGDDRVAEDLNDCWPVIPRGRGDQLFSRKPYNHEERIAGANFVLSCTDCHEAHGSGISSMLRSNPNGGSGTIIWNTMCNNCHYYYSDWHAGMSCGNASCHVSDRMGQTGTNTIHQMSNRYGSSAVRTFDFDKVLDLRFENNLNDSGTWRMHSKWYNAAGSFTGGKVGQAILLDGALDGTANELVQVGTRNQYWSTDAGRHGTWVYTEMKFNTTLEAWVYPTDYANSQYSIFTKHVGYGNGGYEFILKKTYGSLRATFRAQIDNNLFEDGGAAGVRGAYSSVAIPLNAWTHVAATFDEFGPNRDPADPSVGRIRIYVNGEDVTASNPSGDRMQPEAGETSIYAFSENSPWNEAGVGYNGHWCASEFSVGGFPWQNGFIGRIDEAKLWNITKDASYFTPIDQQAGPYISRVGGDFGNDKLWVAFSEGVYANSGATGDLQISDFTFTDVDDGRTITGISHAAGESTAELTLSAPLDNLDDINIDQLACYSSSVFDEYGNPADTWAAAVKRPNAILNRIADSWDVEVLDGDTVVDAFTIEFQYENSTLIGRRPPPDGTVAVGVEAVGTIFWMDLWTGYFGDTFWGAGDMYFGNINKGAGTMSGVVYDAQGGVYTFSGTHTRRTRTLVRPPHFATCRVGIAYGDTRISAEPISFGT